MKELWEWIKEYSFQFMSLLIGAGFIINKAQKRKNHIEAKREELQLDVEKVKYYEERLRALRDEMTEMEAEDDKKREQIKELNSRLLDLELELRQTVSNHKKMSHHLCYKEFCRDRITEDGEKRPICEADYTEQFDSTVK